MSGTDREDWDARYSGDGLLFGEAPSRFLREHLSLLPPGKALELAMGEGRNALYLAANGYQVTGIDISLKAVAKCLRLARAKGFGFRGIVADLERFPIPENAYDLIIDFYYLQRNLTPQIKAGLKAGGMVVFETYTQEQTRYGHPLNPEYLLRPNELLDLFRDLRILVYREHVVPSERSPDRLKAIASLIAQRSAIL